MPSDAICSIASQQKHMVYLLKVTSSCALAPQLKMEMFSISDKQLINLKAVLTLTVVLKQSGTCRWRGGSGDETSLARDNILRVRTRNILSLVWLTCPCLPTRHY